ncbi:LOW QUALITY PROTEIN: ATP-dependent DNA helicase [Frankliniella fusca]|uniref:ATP-dependent DNA helicase n=1 Tax=Frankliniella fusca TaxID=407009 RepID=A0AAE1LES9_9NEOP|nr:LOW QUALITY PROTEIN: ATP-dependent DNA helicase [Frankliniella fusca]
MTSSGGGRDFITINFNDNNDWRLLKNDDSALSHMEKYQCRCEALDAKCLYNVAKCYMLPSERPRTKEAILQIYPKLSPNCIDPTSLDKYCKQQVLLFVPWKSQDQLKGNKTTWKEVYDECKQIIEHNSATISNFNGIQPNREQSSSLGGAEEWMAVSAMGPSGNIQQVTLGSRDIDTSYNWHESFHSYEKYGGIPDLLSFISRMKNEYKNQSFASLDPDHVTFNEEQQNIIDLLQLQIKSLSGISRTHNRSIPKSAIIQGKAGTGKSLVIAKITKLLSDYLGPQSFLLLGPTGVSAININGSTIHSKLLIKTNGTDFAHLNGQQLHAFKKSMANVKFIIIDEFSMVGCEMMHMVDQRLRQGKDQPNEEFGGLFLYMFGDINQLPPVMDCPLYSTNQKSMETIAGKILYDNIDTAFILDNIHRQNDPQFQKILNNISSGNITPDDYKILKTRFTTEVDDAERKRFEDAPHFLPTNKEKYDFNYQILSENIDPITKSRKPVAKIPAKISTKSKNFTMYTLECTLYLSKGSRVILRSNLWVKRGLVNGSVGDIVDIIYHPDATPQEDPPSVLICKFDSYKGPYLNPDLKTIPIGPLQLPHENDNSEKYTVSQFPLCLNYGCTIYKSQRLTMEKAYVQIGIREMRSGLTYVALSRTKQLKGLLLEPFDYSLCMRINRSSAVQKKQNWLATLEGRFFFNSATCPDATLRHFGGMVKFGLTARGQVLLDSP